MSRWRNPVRYSAVSRNVFVGIPASDTAIPPGVGRRSTTATPAACNRRRPRLGWHRRRAGHAAAAGRGRNPPCLAAATNAFVAVPLGQRYVPAVVAARQLIAEGRLGPLSHFYFRLNRPTSARYSAWDSPWMLDAAEAILALDRTILEWSDDTLQSDDPDRARAVLHSLVHRLGESAASLYTGADRGDPDD